MLKAYFFGSLIAWNPELLIVGEGDEAARANGIVQDREKAMGVLRVSNDLRKPWAHGGKRGDRESAVKVAPEGLGKMPLVRGGTKSFHAGLSRDRLSGACVQFT